MIRDKKYLFMVALLTSSVAAQATGIAVNIDVPDSRGDGDAPVPTISDFLPADSNLTVSDTFFNSGGNGNGNGAGWSNFSAGVVVGDFTVTTVGSSNGFNAGDDAWNDLDTILEGYAYHSNANGTNVMTIDGLAAFGSGQTITLTVYGLGDNTGQASTFIADYNGSQLSSSTYYGDTRAGGENNIAYVQFDYVSDGVTDSISYIWNNDGAGTAHINGFSLTVVPEPGTYALLAGALALVATMVRRRRA